MPHADASLVPPTITSKGEFWTHVRVQLEYLLGDQRHWVTNLANASSLIYSALLAFNPHFGTGDRTVNWCGEPRISLYPPPGPWSPRSCLDSSCLEHDVRTLWSHRGARHLADNVITGFYLISSLFPEPRLSGLGDRSAAATSENKLLLGPFCGKPACQSINVSPGLARGVCAGAFLQRKTILVTDVDQYPGHIACDGETKSEIVCPLVLQNGNDQVVLGVLDLDCLVVHGFDAVDQLGLEAITDLIVKSCDW